MVEKGNVSNSWLQTHFLLQLVNCYPCYFYLAPSTHKILWFEMWIWKMFQSMLKVFLFTPDWSLYTCLTQLYGGIDMYNLLHKEQLHVSALFIGHLQVDKWETLVSNYTQLVWVVYSGEVRGGVGTKSRMCCVGWVVWVHGFCYILF